MPHIRRWPIPLFFLLLAPALAQATTMVAMPTERLYARADLVAVVDVQSVKAEQDGSSFVTHVNARVAQAFKGAALGESVKILTPGGTIGRFTQRTEGAPEFVPGETCVVFLQKVASGTYRVVGLEQGKLVIEPDATGAFQVHRSTTMRLVQRTSSGMVDVPPLPETEPMDAYLANLRRLSGAK